MKKLLSTLAAAAIIAAMSSAAHAATLYGQEGTADDGTPAIDASGQGPADADTTNWKYQYGSGSWSGVYAGTDGWVEADSSGDSNIEVEADIEMFYSETISNNKVYFHIGNLYDASAGDLTAFVQQTMVSNNGQWVGISFNGTNKSETDFEKDTNGDYTGVITGGMQSDRHTYATQDKQMDIKIEMNDGNGYAAPGNYGDGAHSTITDTLWWLVNGGAPGSYNLTYRIRLLPEAHQADGDYYLDPAVVSTPVL